MDHHGAEPGRGGEPLAPVALRFGRWLREVRGERGMSQEGVALAAGVAVDTYCRIERSISAGRWANPTLETTLRVILALNVDLAELGRLLEGTDTEGTGP